MKKIILLLLILQTSFYLADPKPVLNGLQKKVLKENAIIIDKIIADNDYLGYEYQVEVLCLIAKEVCNIDVLPVKEYLAIKDTANVIFKDSPVFKELAGRNSYKKYIVRKNPADVVKAMKALKKLN